MLNTITTIRMPDGRQVAFVDWSDKPLFSTVDLAHGFTRQQIDMFSYVVGDRVPSAAPAAIAAVQRTATKRDTNLEAASAMATTEERLVYAIKPEIFALTADEPDPQFDFTTAVPRDATGEPIPNPVMLGVLNQSLLLVLAISMKEYMRAGLGYFNVGFGVYGAGGTMAVAAGAGRTYAVNGYPSQSAVRSYVVPQYMGGTEKFRLFLENPGGLPVNFGNSENGAVDVNTNAVVTMRVYIEGLYKRPVA